MNDRDLKALRKSRSVMLRYVAPGLLAFLTIFYVGAGAWNLWLCNKIARYSDLRLSDIYVQWGGKIDSDASYSGLYLMAIERLGNSILMFGLSFAIVILTIASIIVNRRNQRIINYIESKENETAAGGKAQE